MSLEGDAIRRCCSSPVAAAMSEIALGSWLTPEWRVASSRDALALAVGEVHVWAVDLNQPEHIRLSLLSRLSAGEQYRAQRFQFADDADHYVVAHGALRHILGRYAGVRPERIRFSSGSFGKPAILEPAAAGVTFNMSHSNGLAVIGVARSPHIGVDIEAIRRDRSVLDVAQTCFSAREKKDLLALENAYQIDAFFKGWTRKEAYIKATGDGLSAPLDRFDVSLDPAEPAVLRTSYDNLGVTWTLIDLALGPTFAGALVIGGPYHDKKCWVWTSHDKRI